MLNPKLVLSINIKTDKTANGHYVNVNPTKKQYQLQKAGSAPTQYLPGRSRGRGR